MLISPISVFIEVYVDTPLCNGCGDCVDQCSMGVFRIYEEKAEPVQSQACIGCFKCLSFCPVNAIQTRWIMRA
jgi:Indolepyruvate ferredoxin oxidoreductase, alpha and beta subunits